MAIGERLKTVREQKNLSQGDIEKRTGLLRVYISRVENGHTVPAIETLEKLARALELPLYQLFYDGDEPQSPSIPRPCEDKLWGCTGRDAKTLARFRTLMRRMGPSDRKLLLSAAQKMAQKKKLGSRPSRG
jgi:transcriptional regulator with XRE-family HTH domain